MSSLFTSPVYAPFFGTMGCAAAIVFSCKCISFIYKKYGKKFRVFFFFLAFSFIVLQVFFFCLSFTDVIIFLGLGAAYGTAKSGVGLSAMGVLRPDLVLKCIVPVVMAGILGIYGVVVSVLLSGGRK